MTKLALFIVATWVGIKSVSMFKWIFNKVLKPLGVMSFVVVITPVALIWLLGRGVWASFDLLANFLVYLYDKASRPFLSVVCRVAFESVRTPVFLVIFIVSLWLDAVYCSFKSLITGVDVTPGVDGMFGSVLSFIRRWNLAPNYFQRFVYPLEKGLRKDG